MIIPSIDFGGSGEPLLFLHANGYPPGCYRALLERLSAHYQVSAMLQRPLWDGSDPDEIRDWIPLTDDLLRYLDANHGSPVTCVGHSMGGIALLRAALREPQRFSAIVLLDPVLFTPSFIFGWKIASTLGLIHRLHPLILGAKNRRRRFDDLERLFSGYRRRPTFKYMSDSALRDYIDSIACPQSDGSYQLCYSAEWETRIYETGIGHDRDIWRGLPNLKVPLLIIRGGETDTFSAATGRRVERVRPGTRIETIEKATHLVPLEHPGEVSQSVIEFLSSQRPGL